MLIIALFIIGISFRLMPHVPNFSPIVAIALFSGAYLNKKYSLWVPLAIYIISDLMLGLHGVVLFTWGTILLVTFLGKLLKKVRTVKTSLVYTLLSSVVFFIVTNFGVWVVGWYGHSIDGLIRCYIAAIPFFRTALIGDLVYIGLLIGVYNLVTAKVINPRAKVVLLAN